LLLILVNGCVDEHEKINFMHTDKIGNCFVEWYQPSKGGVYASSLRNCFFTDSLGQYIFLGSCDDDEGFLFSIDSNLFYARKYKRIYTFPNLPSKKQYLDSIIIDLITKKRID
jgi:hypothetical protein